MCVCGGGGGGGGGGEEKNTPPPPSAVYVPAWRSLVYWLFPQIVE